ncbi:TonB-linked outer membrane protein, SusC/RagA family [Segatella baroniae F0067]|uniref:TonB-linked outer membrane protein, SusC/RagA family n=1 Tax=Segatella baroniae F0067 TaxID=1115809 RepID=U2QKL0_9BACT|nr:TonB-dependent receptor [Segatella baroniae]ERK39357.1 TonB-linked outer membrane protein, SusC/RagA family [Segatella baroniae F0067]
MQKIKLFLLCLLLATASAAYAQRQTVKGHVADDKGEPVIGAVVKTADGKVAGVTDADGNFSVSLPKGQVNIIVSAIGLKETRYTVVPGRAVTVKMGMDEHMLDELVVVGYGTQKKSSLTSSVEVIKGDELMKLPATNVDQALAGQVAGLSVMTMTGDPGSPREASLNIRTVTGATASPLLVIDGVPRFSDNTSEGEQRLSDLNPDDIESISVLKDAAAAAVYGVRAANGVILITTKRSKGEGRVRVNYRGQYNVTEATRLPKFLNSYEYAKLYNRAVEGESRYEPFTDEELEMLRTQSNPDQLANSNMLDYLKKHGSSTMHNLSLSGGNKFVRYYVSGAYSNNTGLYSGTGTRRLNYSAKLDATLARGLTLSLDFTGVRSHNKNTNYSTIEQAYQYDPTQPLVLSNGELASVNGGNPLISVYGRGGYVQNTINMHTLSTRLTWQLPWIKGLSAYAKFTSDNNDSYQDRFKKPVALYKYDKKTQQIMVEKNSIYPNAKISMYNQDQFMDNNLYELGLNYDRTFGRHHVTGLLVGNYQEYRHRTLYATNNNLPGVYPEIFGNATQADAHGNKHKIQRQSFVGRATYGFANRYFAEFNFRVDGSVKFHPDHRWAFFPSFSASWIVSNEPFFKNWRQDVLSNVKMRASTGLLGRDGGISDYSYLLTYIYSPGNGYNIGGVHLPSVQANGSHPNRELEWEKSRDYNLGLDLGFWNNRFGVTFEYYWRYRTNLITAAPGYLYPPSTGVATVPNMNYGRIKAWGYDLTVTHRNTVGRNFRYNADFTLSMGRDRIIDYGDETNELENLRRKGLSTGDIFLYEADGLFQTQQEIDDYKLDQNGSWHGKNYGIKPGDIKYKDQNDDNVLDDKDLIHVKASAYPDFNYGLRLGAEWKGLFVNTMFQGVAGYKQYISDNYSLENGTLQRFQDYHLTDTWTPENPDAAYPRVKITPSSDNNRLKSTFWLRDNSFLRWRYINVGYRLPQALLAHLPVSTVQISFTASNLHTWSKLKHMDPESHMGYPIQRSYGFNVNIGF